MALADADLPPQLDQSWRTSEHNKSLGKLMDRLAQQCYMDLNSTLTQMSELGAPGDGAPQVNGALPHDQTDTSELSLRKKRMFMEFAHDQRDRFTKTLVLSDYSRNEEDMAKLIDIKIWQDKQRWAYAHTLEAIGHTKRRMLDFKVPAPNIESAMELLATGKASWVPDLGYIPPKRLSAKQLLSTLRDMNVALATRLNLHDELPPFMNQYTIANGRATFSVSGEFEVDLSVADEDPASPWYFIDVRFLFSPSSDTLNDQLRAHLEPRANEALGRACLQGCYGFLHNFVLTHKINVLRSQAQDLIRSKWFDCIKIESLRRSLIIQYWAGMPGPKSWFEIGISSGTRKSGSNKKSTPTLCVRWFRKGQEVRDEQLQFDWQNLNLEAALMEVISKHCFGKLAMARDGLHTIKDRTAPGSSALSAVMPNPDTTVHDRALSVNIPSLRTPLRVSLEPISGQFSLAPPSRATASAERVLNREVSVDVPRLLATVVCGMAQDLYQRQSELVGWQPIRNVAVPKEKFGTDLWKHSVFSLPNCGQQWGLGITFGLGGETWWVMELKSVKPQDNPDRVSTEVLQAHKLDVTDIFGVPTEISRASLVRVERRAGATISRLVLSRQLDELKVPYDVKKASALTDVKHRRGPDSNEVSFVQFSALMRDTTDKDWKPWARDAVRISYHGRDGSVHAASDGDERALVRHDLRLSIGKDRLPHLRQHFKPTSGADTVMNDNGGLALRLQTPFGEPLLGQVKTRLRSVERLDGYINVLQKLHYTCTFVSLAKLCFTYSKSPELDAQLSFANDGSLPVRLKLEPADSNPHLRIMIMLERCLNSRITNSFIFFASTLSLTLPLLQAFDRLETAHLARRTATAHARGIVWYEVAYRAPLPVCKFSIKSDTKRRNGKAKVFWHLTQHAPRSESTILPEGFEAALKGLWREKGQGWFGVGNGAIADAAGIAVVVMKLDEVMRRFESIADPVEKSGGETAPIEQSAPGKTATNASQPAAQSTASKTAVKVKEEPDVIMLD
ncbi:hypothetical protein BAUCODRAFT_62964 [Baudoinia panamericana UAMH 10762]|uniref:Mediator of RNA polymerase II transcription subunit 14 n=1 Tax=Baudoinia panamericana (strain UAMH 10762) TaxID=717646 RepID=M2N7L7_BAUPA|nr:uncharacterized protein BAUCODRAFT_62964 [Baudoinia panamericana UAMH 10762]EMD00089.1 hypothetical protein BAUCODRAFT_62964 [Baudoinia panamericana UAMH 10762]